MQRELPIKRLLIARELSLLLKNADESIKKCNVFIASFGKMAEAYIEFVKLLRQEKKNIFIVFILDKKADVSACVRPSVRPAGILFIPLEQLRVYQTIREIYIENLRILEREEQPVFTIKNGADYFTINTGDISFFEAQGKKIALKTRGQEILFYSNFNTILEQLPDWFLRCHKGFVVNTKEILKANFTEMTLTLRDKCTIPISRTYKDEIKAFLKLREV